MLPVSTSKAIEILNKNPKGFFLMIEGALMDFAGYDNDASLLIDETLDFNKALGEVLDFAQKDGETLVTFFKAGNYNPLLWTKYSSIKISILSHT